MGQNPDVHSEYQPNPLLAEKFATLERLSVAGAFSELAQAMYENPDAVVFMQGLYINVLAIAAEEEIARLEATTPELRLRSRSNSDFAIKLIHHKAKLAGAHSHSNYCDFQKNMWEITHGSAMIAQRDSMYKRLTDAFAPDAYRQKTLAQELLPMLESILPYIAHQ